MYTVGVVGERGEGAGLQTGEVEALPAAAFAKTSSWNRHPFNLELSLLVASHRRRRSIFRHLLRRP